MHSILIAIYEPRTGNTVADKQAKSEWQAAVSAIEGEACTYVGNEELSRGCWLISGAASLRILGLAIGECERNRLRYKVLFLEKVSELPAQVVASTQQIS
jgi:hypothetical protein